jgi:CHAT domain-containing protein/tetratricopeptide (TPR) repeat protein
MPTVCQPSGLNLAADVLRENDPDPNRVILWRPGAREGRIQHWERVSGHLLVRAAAAEGLAAIPVRVTRFQEGAPRDLRQFFVRLWKRAARSATRYVLPTGGWAEPVGPPRNALLVWTPDDEGLAGPAIIEEVWPANEQCTQLGPNLFLVLGVDAAAPDTGSPEIGDLPAQTEDANPQPGPNGEHRTAAADDEAAPADLQQEFERLSQTVSHLTDQRLRHEAVDQARHLLGWVRQHWGENHPRVITALNHLGRIYQLQGDLDTAESFYRQALAVNLPIPGGDHPNFATSMNNLALVCQARGNYAAAEALHRRALQIRQACLGDQHPLVAVSLNNLGVLYHAANSPNPIGPLLSQALDILHAALGEAHPDVAACLDNLAALCQTVGNDLSGALFAARARQIRQSIPGKDFQRVQDSLNILAEWDAVHQADPAADFLQNKEAAAPEQTAEDTWSLMDGGPDVSMQPQEQNAVADGAGAFAESASEPAALHENLDPGMASVAEVAVPADAAILSEPVAPKIVAHEVVSCRKITDIAPDQPALPIDEASAVPDIPVDAPIDPILPIPVAPEAILPEIDQPLDGGFEELPPVAPPCLPAVEIIAFAEESSEPFAATTDPAADDIQVSSNPMAEAAPDQLEMESHVSPVPEEPPDLESDWSISVADETPVAEPVQMIAPAGSEQVPDHDRLAESYRATDEDMAAEAPMRKVARSSRLVLDSNHPDWTDSMDRLAMMCRTGRVNEALALVQQAITGHPGETGRNVLLSLVCRYFADSREAVQIALEAVFRHKAAAAAPRDEAREPGLPEVARALPAGSALLEYVRFGVYDFGADRPDERPTTRYLAFVLRGGEPEGVALIDLGPSGAIDAMVVDLCARIAGGGEEGGWPGNPITAGTPAHARILDVGTKVRKAVFDPLAGALAGRTRLFVATPEGLAGLPFEVLPDGEGRYLLDTHQISYLGTGCDLLAFGRSVGGETGPAVVAADPDFDFRETKFPALLALARRGPAPCRPFRGGDDAPLRFPRLAGTRRCALSVADLLGVEPWLAGAVRKRRLQELRRPRLLHLATHCLGSEGGNGPAEGAAVFGLAVAGANRDTPGEAAESVLTAVEIAALDLTGTELVVLPASGGEGLLALCRAFVQAGAAAVVASRWRVTDWYAKELLLDFYSRVLDGAPRADALWQSQRACKARYPDHPAYWAAFMCHGDPGPLAREAARSAGQGLPRLRFGLFKQRARPHSPAA